MLFLAARHGHLRQVRRRSSRYPKFRSRRHDNVPIQRRRRFWYTHYVDRPVHPPNSLRLDLWSFRRFRRYPSPYVSTLLYSYEKLVTNSLRSWFSYVFTYKGPNTALLGFYNAIVLVMETGFALTAFLTLILNLILPEEIEDAETPEITANNIEEPADDAEWNRIRKSKDFDAEKGSSEGEIATASRAQ